MIVNGITAELLNTSISTSFPNGTSFGGQGEALCPKCKVANIILFNKVAKCADQNCYLLIFRNVSERYLTDKHIAELLTTGKTSVIKGFKGKSGKSFDAALKFDENFKTVFDFSDKKEKK